MSRPISASTVASKLPAQCQGVVCGSLASESPGAVLGIHISRPYPRPTEAGIQGDTPESAFHNIPWGDLYTP